MRSRAPLSTAWRAASTPTSRACVSVTPRRKRARMAVVMRCWSDGVTPRASGFMMRWARSISRPRLAVGPGCAAVRLFVLRLFGEGFPGQRMLGTEDEGLAGLLGRCLLRCQRIPRLGEDHPGPPVAGAAGSDGDDDGGGLG